MNDATQWPAITGSTLFYPCCGCDLETPLRIFGGYVSDFYFVDTRRSRLPSTLRQFAAPCDLRLSPDVTAYRDLGSDNRYQIHRWTRRAEDALDDIPSLGVFFHRGDTLAEGEGSSGVPWLGQRLLKRILEKLIPGGLVVTDGSNNPPDGPRPLSAFHWLGQGTGAAAVQSAQSFTFFGRRFTCVGYAGERYGPTLIWRVD